jgi:competence protein ComGC
MESFVMKKIFLLVLVSYASTYSFFRPRLGLDGMNVGELLGINPQASATRSAVAPAGVDFKSIISTISSLASQVNSGKSLSEVVQQQLQQMPLNLLGLSSHVPANLLDGESISPAILTDKVIKYAQSKGISIDSFYSKIRATLQAHVPQALATIRLAAPLLKNIQSILSVISLVVLPRLGNQVNETVRQGVASLIKFAQNNQVLVNKIANQSASVIEQLGNGLIDLTQNNSLSDQQFVERFFQIVGSSQMMSAFKSIVSAVQTIKPEQIKGLIDQLSKAR